MTGRIGRWMRRMVCAAITMVVAAPASAEWREARSRHFVVYSEGNEAELRETATRLEQYDRLLRTVAATSALLDAQPVPVTIYIVGDEGDVRRLYGRGSGNIGGFYMPRAAGSVAYTPRHGSGTDDEPQIILFHEYAHHFLLGNYASAYPRWFSEGYAEYAGVTRFMPDTVTFGRPANSRIYDLYAAREITAADLFAADDPKGTGVGTAGIYGRGWLLTHLIMNDRARATQFVDYLRRLNSGTVSSKAAAQAFGDMKALNRDLTIYYNRGRFPVHIFQRAELAVPPVALRSLRPGEAAMLPFRMRSDRGVDDGQARTLYAAARPIALAYRDDPVVQGWFAEMAYDAKQDEVAEQAADRALALDPKAVQALLYKARVHLRRAAATKGDAAAWQAARGLIVRANHVDNNDADALSLYYDSFVMADTPAPASARAGLYRAVELVPQDPELRWAAARQHILDGDVDAAKSTLRPIAFDPHAGADNPAGKLFALLEAGTAGREALAQIERERAAAAKGKASTGG